jgi:YHS domain-containing protein
MNRLQQIASTQVAPETKRLFDAKDKPPAKPIMKRSLIVLALWAFTAYHSNATAATLLSNRVGGTLKTSQLRTQVWVEKRAHKVNLDSNGVILKGYDPVAYFAQKKAVKGSSKYQSTYQGATYYFSSAADLATFKANPSKYVPQYGGFCANGVKNNNLRDADPTVFFIVKGKLYVCESHAAEREFRTHEDEDIVTANRNWYQLRD